MAETVTQAAPTPSTAKSAPTQEVAQKPGQSPTSKPASTDQKISKQATPETKKDPKTGDAFPEDAKKDVAAEEGAGKFKLVVRGKEVEVDAENYHRYAQKGLAFEPMMQDYAETKKVNEAIISSLKNPDTVFELLKQAGHDVMKLAVDYVHEHGVRRGSLTPEQRELEDLRREREQRIAEQKAREEEAKQTEEQRAQTHYRAEYERGIISAMESAPDIPRNEHTVQIFAELMLSKKQQMAEVGDTRPVRATDFVDQVRAYYDKLTRDFQRRKVETAKSDEDILGLIDEPIRDRLRKAELARVGSAPRQRSTESAPPTSNGQPKKLGKKEWEQAIMERASS